MSRVTLICVANSRPARDAQDPAYKPLQPGFTAKAQSVKLKMSTPSKLSSLFRTIWGYAMEKGPERELCGKGTIIHLE